MQRLAESIRDCAEILADDQAAGPLALDGGERDQRLHRKAHIGPCLAFRPARHPELPGKAQDVIDSKGGGAPHVGAQDRGHRLQSAPGKLKR